MARIFTSLVFVLVWASVSLRLQADSVGTVEQQPESGRFEWCRGIYWVPLFIKLPQTGTQNRVIPVSSGILTLQAKDESGKPTRESLHPHR